MAGDNIQLPPQRGVSLEPTRRHLDVQDQVAQDVRDQAFRRLDQLGVTFPGNAIREPLNEWNVIRLAPGIYGAPRVQSAHTRVVADGAVFDGDVTITLACSFRGIRFTGKITIESPAIVSFEHCTFNRINSGSATQIENQSGAKVVLIGCLFSGITAAGNLINNGGVAGDVQVVACRRDVTNAYGTVTSVGSL